MTTPSPPAAKRSVATKRPPGRRSARIGVRAQMASKSSISRGMPASTAIASRWSTALVEPPVAENEAIAFSKASRVAIDRGLMPVLDKPHREPARGLRDGWFVGMSRRDRVGARGRQPEKLERGAHRVRRVLTGTRARPRAGVLLHRAKLVGVDAAGVVCADSLEDILDREVATVQVPRLDGAAVEHETRNVEPAQRHRGPRDRLVATDDEHQPIEAVPAGHELDRVGDQIA